MFEGVPDPGRLMGAGCSVVCRFPGCSRPAIVCDLDHTVPFNQQNPAACGQAVLENLKPAAVNSTAASRSKAS